MKQANRFLPFILFLLLISSCQEDKIEEQDEADLGVISIDVTGAPEAIPVFKEALLLMHSFEYQDARDKFIEAQNIDPNFAMAFWGEAMTHNHPLWRETKPTKANLALKKLAPNKEERLKKLKTEFEKDLFAGAEILFSPGLKEDKDNAYKEHMASLYEKYPGNHEIGAFYALSILGATQEERDYKSYEQGAKIVQGIIDENPQHPGALHYLIHSYDDPVNAPKALFAANNYAKVAPDAGHALHMPSHIYAAMGMWDEVISSNIASFNASVNRKKAKSLSVNALNFHALHWRMYAHLQKGEFEKAKELVLEMASYCEEEQTPKSLGYNAEMKTAYLVATQEWNDPLGPDDFDYTELNVMTQAIDIYKKAQIALAENKPAELEKLITQLNKTRNLSLNEAQVAGAQMCSGASNRQMATQLDIDRAEVVELELRALLALHYGEQMEAEDWLLQAVAKEESTTFNYGPPDIVKPSNELYADWLMQQKRFKEAKKQYAKVLERAPKRLLSTEALLNLEES